MAKWWFFSVPYLLVFTVLVLHFKLSPGMLAHVLVPFLLLFWIALYSSLAWTAVSCARVLLTRSALPKTLDLIRLGLAILASALGVYVEFFWTGNV